MKAKKRLSARERAKLRSYPFGSPARTWALGVFLAAMLIVGTAALSWVLGRMTALPAPAPKFSLPSSTGHVVGLDNFLGHQEVVLLFYMVYS